MREEYDCLLAAAQTVSSSAYDFSRSIHDMGSCIMETFEKIGDNELGSSLSMLVKVQYEISKLLEHYAARVSQTFIESTKNLLEELELVEEIREQYQRKRDLYDDEVKSQKVKGKDQKVDASDEKEDLNKEAAHLDHYLQSLRPRQEMSFATHAVRHYKAQVHFFGKGVSLLNAIESTVTQLSARLNFDDTMSNHASGLKLDKDLYVNGDNNKDQPATRERREHREADMLKPRENVSKSAPLYPSLHYAKGVQDLDMKHRTENSMPYALPNPTGQTARFPKWTTNTARRTEQSHDGERPELSRIWTGSTDAHDGSRCMEERKEEAYRQTDVKYSVEREETQECEVNSDSDIVKQSSHHSHSSSFSEGFDTLSSHKQSIFFVSPPTFTHSRGMKENSRNRIANHTVDPPYKSGPVGRSAPWSISPSRISPCPSPQMSHLSPPLISELHKLPAPPLQSVPCKVEPDKSRSAPLGTGPVYKLKTVTPTVSASAASFVHKSHSTSLTNSFVNKISNTKVIKSDNSPVIESP
ncbi:hypothetical protein KP509_38G016000 [Ceratopteris richardii]|nr:hypothetical protein KP509_38G016000 [Ceratopteris richardii]